MTAAQLLASRFPNASRSCLAANSQNSRPTPKLERDSGNVSLGKDQGQKGATAPIHLRIVSVRKRLCDPDNLSPKWTIDALRYCGIISGDEPDKITLETSQRKAEKGETEHTLIELRQSDLR